MILIYQCIGAVCRCQICYSLGVLKDRNFVPTEVGALWLQLTDGETLSASHREVRVCVCARVQVCMRGCVLCCVGIGAGR